MNSMTEIEVPVGGQVLMPLRAVLQAEGLMLLGAGALAFHALGQSWWLFAAVFFVPDLAFAAYLAGRRIGAFVYNCTHSLIGAASLGAFAYFAGDDMAGSLAAIWVAHIGFDRMLGYGLKYSSGFGDTHLLRMGKKQAD